MVRVFPCPSVVVRLCVWTVAFSLSNTASAQQASDTWARPGSQATVADQPDWLTAVGAEVRLHQLAAALKLVDERLQIDPSDMEARGWRGRLLAWQEQWAAAEAEYRLVLERVPNDTEVLCGLADVLLWQGKNKEALEVIERARVIDEKDAEILLRRARILQALENSSEARRQYREVLALHPDNQEAKTGLAALSEEEKHELRIGADASTFNSIGPAEDEAIFLTSHWTPRFTTAFNTGMYERFGQVAGSFVSSATFRLTKNDSLTAGGALATHQSIIPESEAFFEYGHGLHFSNRWIQGLEASYEQHWFWYEGAHVLIVRGTQLYYLPKEWTWTLSVTGARSGFTGTGVEWVPSGYARLGFPVFRKLGRNLSGDVLFANGTEDFAQIDQIGHFSARTYGGGVKYRFAPGRDVTGYFARQDRTDGETENSYGVSCGFHF